MHALEIRRLLPKDLTPVITLDQYKATGGTEGLKKARSMDSNSMIEELKKANLRGRGGAGFPTWIKWGSLANDPYPDKFLACNGSEGEPGTYKDRWLLLHNPYLVLEGMMIAAEAVGAKGCVFGIKKRHEKQIENIERALREFEEDGLFEKGFLTIVYGPDEYLFGEETGLLEVIDGRDAMPRNIPPYVQGVGGTPHSPNPSIVNNIETYSQISLIFQNDADWFREVGSEDTPGTIIFTVSGDVKKPGMYEVPLGITMNQLLNDICEGPVGNYPFKGVLSGVASGVLTPDKFDTPIGFNSMREVGSGLGSAGFMVYDESACMVKLARTLSNFLAKSSCGQCIPCNAGTRDVTECLDVLLSGNGTKDVFEEITSILGRSTTQTRCYLPIQETILIPSLINTYSSEFEAYAQGRTRDGGERILPKINYFDSKQGQFVYDDPGKFD